jgi:hypothetical protein
MLNLDESLPLEMSTSVERLRQLINDHRLLYNSIFLLPERSR